MGSSLHALRFSFHSCTNICTTEPTAQDSGAFFKRTTIFDGYQLSDGSGIDALALGKLTVCSLLVCFTARELWISYFKGFERIAFAIGPLFAFLVWAAASVVWSPSPISTVSQLAGIVALVTLMLCVAMGCRSAKEFDKVFGHLCLSLLAMNCFVLLLHLIRPDLSGLDRTVEPLGADGAIHPTAAGANSSLGLILGFTACFIWKPQQRVFKRISLKVLGVLMMAVSSFVLVFAASRTALGLALLVVPIAWFSAASRRATGRVLVLGSVALMVLMLVDPQFSVAIRASAKVVDAAYRGGTQSQLATLNGRTDMWAAIWVEFQKSPWLGHGFGVTSEEGSFLMWQRHLNHTAHNLILQVLVSTGVIGSALFAWGLLWPIGRAFWQRATCPQSRQLRHAAGIVLLWYFGWSQLCITFVGPLRTESVAFFTLVGMLIANSEADRKTLISSGGTAS